ncbi:MAG: PAS domain S-box protein [Desulfomonile tiedjei]|nr:PAS domain S-box protein [Desulfomonile tiedjei]
MEPQDEIEDGDCLQSVDLPDDSVPSKASASESDHSGRFPKSNLKFFRQLFVDRPFGAAAVNWDRQLLSVNPRLCRMLEFTEDELTGLTLSAIIHPDDIEKEIEYSGRLFAGEIRDYTIAVRFVRKDGEPLWIDLTASLIRDAGGRVVYGLWTMQDINEHKRAEDELRKSLDQLEARNEEGTVRLTQANEGLVKMVADVSRAEKAVLESNERLLSVVETANDPILGADCEGKLIMWNSAATRVFGYTAEEALNQPITLLMPQRFAKIHERALERAVESGRLYYAKRVREVAGRRKDGTEFPVEVSISGWKAQQNMFFTAIVRDITERKQKEEQLRRAYEELESRVVERTMELVEVNENLRREVEERTRIEEMLRTSERLYHTLVEEVPDVIFVLDHELRFNYLNAQAETLFGRPLQDLLDSAFAAYVVPEEKKKIEAISEASLDSTWDEEIRLADADGQKKFVRVRCKPLGNDGNGNIHYEGVMRDITRRRRLEEQLKESREQLLEKIRIIDELYAHIVESGKARAIAEHTAEVAHELRQPLTIIGGFARRIARQLDACNMASDTGQAQAARIMSSEIQRLEKILNTLIDFTRRETISTQMSNPDAIIEKVLSLYREVLEEKTLKLDATLRGEVGEISVDPERFEQVVRNLVSNAIEASPVGETVHIETGISIPSHKALQTGALESESYFELKIRNHGPVIKEKDLNSIFSPFFTTKSYGTGIGLTVSKKIVEAHNGSISVHSDDTGTSFTVWLPLNQQESAVRLPA